MDPLDLYLKPSGPSQQPMTVAPEANGDPLDIYLKPPSEKTAQPQTSAVKEFAKGGAYGAVQSTGNILSALGPAAQTEGGMPIYGVPDTPSPEQTFKILQEATGPLSPGTGVAGQWGRNIGGTIPYMFATPGGGGFISKLIQSGLMGTGATAGEIATKDTALEPYGPLAGALVAPYAAGKAIQSGEGLLSKLAGPGKAAVTKDQIFEAGSEAFNQARKLDVKLHPNAISDFANMTKYDLNEMGYGPELSEKVHKILDRKISDAERGLPVTVNDLLGFRKKLLKAQGSIDPQEKAAATIAKYNFDNYIGNLPTSSVVSGNAIQLRSLLDTGRKNWAAAERMETTDSRIANAELRASTRNSGMNASNLIRGKLADIVLSPKLSAGWSPQALEQATKVAEGTGVGNKARYVKNLFGGGGGLGAFITGGVGELAAGSPLGLLLSVPGTVGHIVENMSTGRQLNKLTGMLASESPLAKSMPPTKIPASLQKLVDAHKRALIPAPYQALFNTH